MAKYLITIPPDEEGLTGRECPILECLGYFKIQLGTGLKGENLPCHCPYCGHSDTPSSFGTKEQMEYAKSVALHQISKDMIGELKKLEFDLPAKGAFGFGLSMKVKGTPPPIRYYREKQLETEVACDQCTLRYAIYGVFGYCPDCGVHNSLQILNKNLDLVKKELGLAATVDADLAERLTDDALENSVSAFDGFGRETCRVHSISVPQSPKGESLSFQNLHGARKRVQELFGFDFGDGVTDEDWEFACRCFQRRHLLAHKMGVIDEAYTKAANDPKAVVGRKVGVRPSEVSDLLPILRKLGASLAGQ